jgi:DNA polymerase III alpha subunit
LIINAHSYYSLRYGTIPVKELVSKAALLGIKTLALTDINNTTGIIDFVKACKQNGIKPIAGIEFRSNGLLRYIGLAVNNEGFRELNEFLSQHNLEEAPLPERPPDFANVFIIWPLNNIPRHRLRDHEHIGIKPGEITKMMTLSSRFARSKLVILHTVTFINRDDFVLHQNLRAIDNNTLITMLTPRAFRLRSTPNFTLTTQLNFTGFKFSLPSFSTFQNHLTLL